MPNSILLILTVGTGTQGPDSFIAGALQKTVELLSPRQFWLVPSSSPTSIDVADYICADFPDSFSRWSDADPYLQIGNPDSLEECRTVVREVICRARENLQKGERLIVNPTSGTKQMSSGATVAALNEGIGELVFTVGERSGGIVKSGTERLETFDASGYFAEAAFSIASLLFCEGSFSAAATVLAKHPCFRSATDLCRCLHEWERSNYSEALRIGESSGHQLLASLIPALETLAGDRARAIPSPAVVADLLRSAKHLQTVGEFESSLLRSCKALEMGLRLDLHRRCGISEPYRLANFEGLNSLPAPLVKKLRANATIAFVRLGFRDLVDLLLSQKSEVAALYESSNGAKKAVQNRNDLAHQLGSVTQERAFNAIRDISGVLAPLILPTPTRFPKNLSLP